MNFQQRIDNLVRGESKSSDDYYEEIMFVLIQEYHWSYEEINEAPINFILNLLKRLKKYRKQQKVNQRKR